MKGAPELVVMLTHDDLTIHNAYEVFENCKDSKAQYWGFKEKPLQLAQMKELFSYMSACGKTTVLEVVSYTEEESLEGARIDADCGCDILLGTLFCGTVNEFCKRNGIKYIPYIGEISGRPSVLRGSIDNMIAYANRCLDKGVYGFDLLGYRYAGDASELIKRFVSDVGAPVCIAGSVNSYQRLDELKEFAPWAFTIGSAFIENKFEGTIGKQIDQVCEYMGN